MFEYLGLDSRLAPGALVDRRGRLDPGPGGRYAGSSQCVGVSIEGVSPMAHSLVEVVTDTQGTPMRVRWRGRWYTVRTVVGHWVEVVPWWRTHLPWRGVRRTHTWRVVLSRVESARVESARVESARVEKNVTVIDVMARDATWQVVSVVD